MTNAKLIKIALMAIFAGLATAGCTPAENTSTTSTTTVTATPAPDTAAIVAEITRIENDWPRIIREKDGAAVRRLEADEVLLVYPDGSAGNKEQDVKDIEAGMITFESWDISDMNIHVLDNDTAVARFLITVGKGKLTNPDGRTQDISGKYRVIDTFARRNGQWQLVASGATPLSAAAAAAASASPTASPKADASPAMKASPRMSPTRSTSSSPAGNQ